jgi:glutamyl-tRNA reductase
MGQKDGGWSRDRIRQAVRTSYLCVSVASAAAEVGEKIFSSLTERSALLIGTGDISQKVARALHSRGACILVAGRSYDRAAQFATQRPQLFFAIGGT